jgi:hypothetical protein
MYANKAANKAFPKKPDKNTFISNLSLREAFKPPKTESRAARMATAA